MNTGKIINFVLLKFQSDSFRCSLFEQNYCPIIESQGKTDICQTKHSEGSIHKEAFKSIIYFHNIKLAYRYTTITQP